MLGDSYPRTLRSHILSVHCVYLKDAITPSLRYTRVYDSNKSWLGSEIFILQEIPACQYFVSSSTATKHVGSAAFLAKMEQSISLPADMPGEPRNQLSSRRIAREREGHSAELK